MKPEPCWYCGRPSDLLCDYQLGTVLAPDRCEWDPAAGAPAEDSTKGCPNRATQIVGADGDLRACDSCAAAPELRRRRTRKAINPTAEVVATCDAAACASCAKARGWKRIAATLVCRRGRGGCTSETVDRCDAHAEAGEGSTEWIGAAAVELERSRLRAACRGGR